MTFCIQTLNLPSGVCTSVHCFWATQGGRTDNYDSTDKEKMGEKEERDKGTEKWLIKREYKGFFPVQRRLHLSDNDGF